MFHCIILQKKIRPSSIRFLHINPWRGTNSYTETKRKRVNQNLQLLICISQLVQKTSTCGKTTRPQDESRSEMSTHPLHSRSLAAVCWPRFDSGPLGWSTVDGRPFRYWTLNKSPIDSQLMPPTGTVCRVALKGIRLDRNSKGSSIHPEMWSTHGSIS